jgi:hypothetical protein
MSEAGLTAVAARSERTGDDAPTSWTMTDACAGGIPTARSSLATDGGRAEAGVSANKAQHPTNMRRQDLKWRTKGTTISTR